MKRTLVILLALILLLTAASACGSSSADSAPAPVTPTEEPIDGPGALPPAEGCVTVSCFISRAGSLATCDPALDVYDEDGDGDFTINDVMITAHNRFYVEKDGYRAEKSDIGLFMTRLWGEDGFYFSALINNAYAIDMSSPVTDGDFVAAFSYADTDSWSDLYSYFDLVSADINAGDELELSLFCLDYDANGNPSERSVPGAELILSSTPLELKTDENGHATLRVDEPGYYILSASTEDCTLVPPVCFVNVH